MCLWELFIGRGHDERKERPQGAESLSQLSICRPATCFHASHLSPSACFFISQWGICKTYLKGSLYGLNQIMCAEVSLQAPKHHVIISCDYQFEKLAFIMSGSIKLPPPCWLGKPAWGCREGHAGPTHEGSCPWPCPDPFFLEPLVPSEVLSVGAGHRSGKGAQEENGKDFLFQGLGVKGAEQPKGEKGTCL